MLKAGDSFKITNNGYKIASGIVVSCYDYSNGGPQNLYIEYTGENGKSGYFKQQIDAPNSLVEKIDKDNDTIKAVKADATIGDGSCSWVNECLTDEELINLIISLKVENKPTHEIIKALKEHVKRIDDIEREIASGYDNWVVNDDYKPRRW